MLRKTFFFTIIMFISVTVLIGQNLKVDSKAIKKTISIIASDEYEGRETGTIGCIKTEEFFAENFKKLGLVPAGENKTFFHSYTFRHYKPEGNFRLVIGERTFYYGAEEDYQLERNSLGGSAEGNIVLAGYGIYAPEAGRNDYKNVDMKDKIVVIKKGAPETSSKLLTQYASDSAKAVYCFNNGAKGILMYEPPSNSHSEALFTRRYYGSLPAEKRINNFPVFNIDHRVASYIFKQAGLNYSSFHRTLDDTPNPVLTNVKAQMNAEVSFDNAKKTRNVLAMIPGTDTKLKHEAIVIGGHMDHLGVRYDGAVYNGADDNASGVAVALGIAETMMKNKIKPKRTIIFACWSGEEKGLFGSYAWSNNPTWDLKKVVVYFNLDMVGLGDGKLNMPGVYYAENIWDMIKQNIDTSLMNKVNPSKGGTGGSDHTPFLKKGVPAFAGMTSGDHPDYHQPEDDAEFINEVSLQTTGDFILNAALFLANYKGSLINNDREDEIRFRLLSIRNITPLPFDKLENSYIKSNVPFTLVDISSALADDKQSNFLSALKLVSDIKSGKYDTKKQRFLLSITERERYRTVFYPTIKLSKSGYDPLFTEALFNGGIKTGIISNDIASSSKNENLNEQIAKISKSGMVLLYDTPEKALLESALKNASKSIGIVIENAEMLDDETTDKIKSKEHLVVYRFSNAEESIKIAETIIKLRQKLSDNLIALTPKDINEESYKKFREITGMLSELKITDDFINRLVGGNIAELIMKVTGERDVRFRRR